MRGRQELWVSKCALRRDVAVLWDGRRRWARDAGHEDVSYGYRVGADKIAEMLRWCSDAGIEMATVYLLSTENLQREPGELRCLIEIVTEVVEQICAPANRWSVRTVGDLELLGEESARRLREAVEGTAVTAPHAEFHVNVAVGYGGRQEIADAVRGLLGKELANGATAEQLIDAVTVEAIDAKGRFLGGLILPGHGIMLRALESGTAGLHVPTGEVRQFPTNTSDALGRQPRKLVPVTFRTQHCHCKPWSNHSDGMLECTGQPEPRGSADNKVSP